MWAALSGCPKKCLLAAAVQKSTQKYTQNPRKAVTLATKIATEMKKYLYALFLFLCAAVSDAQEGTSSYRVLNLPLSSHAAALGGRNISLLEDTPWAGWNNPALYSSVSDKSIGLDFMTYAGGSAWMGAQYVAAFGERHTAAFHVAGLAYGRIDETDVTGSVIGSFSPLDVVVGGAYSYLLSDRWAGGAALKTVFSSYADYSAIALSVDLGLNYYDEATDFSLSAALRNVGAQLKSFDGRTERVPFCAELGLTKGIAHAPLRLSVTATDLTRWSSSHYFHPEGEDLSFGKLLLNHFVVGVDILPTDYIYLSAGYNFRRAYELKAAGSAHGAGLSFGAGLHLKRFKLGFSYAKYHVSTASLLFNVAYAI